MTTRRDFLKGLAAGFIATGLPLEQAESWLVAEGATPEESKAIQSDFVIDRVTGDIRYNVDKLDPCPITELYRWLHAQLDEL